ncbi:4Fe-4S dicluster domain-containing protein (plasmid) [Haloferax mediterranei ATCC 33500]|uniref:4Fe-4S dicluster domain-containing protein n=1 Tax=Haloferax mediterranei (strain ATCC 33500 / DSM 1411 / JCM 8866 / NBRC 14739 / NCIMB 2177 / R-4) TaxID=523841 RepID=I3RBI9_HALMT|nr:Coenzyme F420 hydrogenase/dehydrogenase, beta subunit C-terminal domain [Haloferax mediterranei]AFK21599.1 coenzyme F420-reducing hydrogenase, beta subunit [Haloferax mediterranei ATCC 33500]AHZ24355.1 coenzyme F420 hydrogenase [Haloferax mediterranei ATCC 33500]ELZ97090.1 coenzyme F420-reducing hydrogenase subunit beta [Haloferax mediterranei ATCC 33500]MDX5990163.1 Coenzyme F420 hydrogenase/dehydrogenase, beta subunit C-terminal domain [Haloferax mediterranei ATCC 33500]QCQ76762.1 4Fe-4S 
MTTEDTENERERPLPHVPETDTERRRNDDNREYDGVGSPPVSGHRSKSGPRYDSDVKPIKYRRRSGRTDDKETDEGCGRSDESCGCGRSDESCGCGRGCGCDTSAGKDVGTDGSTTETSSVSADGGTRPSNVDAAGNLTTLEFTTPSEGKSQDVSDGRPDRRVQVPEGVELDTPGYSIRQEMNDIDEPEDKTWFMELDAAVIDEGRCIQCGTCVASCPSDSIGIGDDGLPKLVKMCTGCSLCWDFCPRGGLRYERQWKITGGEDNVNGAGDPITEFSAKVEEAWRENAQDGGLVTSVLIHLLEAGEIDGALIATESEDEPWKAESFLATTPEELIENAGSFYNQTMALGNLNVDQWKEKLPAKDPESLSLALVGTPCEIEGIRALQDFEWDYASQEEGIRAIDYTIALMCTKNFNYERLIGEQLEAKRGIAPEEIGKMDVLNGDMMVYDRDGEMILQEDIEAFHGAALKGCDECADFTGYCADLTVGSVGSSDEYSSVIIRTEQGLKAWELTEPDLDYHDLEDRSAIGGLQSWDKKKAFKSLQRPFDPDAPRFIEYTEHASQYDVVLNPHESDH